MLILKIGGGKNINTKAIIEDLAKFKENNPNEKVIIIQGANHLRDSLAKKLNIKKEVITSFSGYDSVLSNKDIIDLQMMAYAGLKNKRLVELCQQNNINAIGLSGIDGKLIQAKRNRGIKVKEDGKFKLIKDLSGKPTNININLLNLLLNNGYTPILCVPLIDEKNTAINSENDDIVKVLTWQMNEKNTKIIMLLEAKGFLEDFKDPDSLIKQISIEELKQKTEQVEGRMKRKMLSLTKLFEPKQEKEAYNHPTVYLSDGRIKEPITKTLKGEGTTIN